MKSSSWGSLAVVLLAALGSPRAATAASAWGANYFPNSELTTQDGKVVHFYDDMLKGKAVAINLIYTRCTANCPLETAKLAQVQRVLKDRVGKDIFFISISIDPKHDTPEAMKKYMQKFHVGPGWTFLTGKKEDVREISHKLGLSSMTDAANRDGHQPSLMIGYVPTGAWMLNSAVDNPRFLAGVMTKFLDGAMRRDGALAQASVANVAPQPAPTAEEAGERADPGQLTFISKCSACHTLGAGDSVGPDLVNIAQRRDRVWLTNYLLEPDRMLAQHDPIAMSLFEKYQTVRMPNLGLSLENVDQILKYISKESRAQTEHASAR
jgi:protein SCO1/2